MAGQQNSRNEVTKADYTLVGYRKHTSSEGRILENSLGISEVTQSQHDVTAKIATTVVLGCSGLLKTGYML